MSSSLLTRALYLLALVASLPVQLSAQSLRGSSSSVDRMARAAAEHGFSYMETPGEVRAFVNDGYLVPIYSTATYELSGVAFPYLRPEAKRFIERLSTQYRSSCGERLVVTSATRPLDRQPANASSRSVHPTGMAVDLRRSRRASCRHWIERTLLSLEGTGVLEATKERYPAHYHVAVFPQEYRSYLASAPEKTARKPSPRRLRIAESSEDMQIASVLPAPARTRRIYRVRANDNLSRIAKVHHISVARLKKLNGLKHDRIVAGQKLRVR